ncbi:MAG TPA: two-component regulator propeller domain-containing protein [Chitinophagales bacterium]|nr:two-component regulator propeller domain-containing protein [Chitinophagales bacterium]
MRFIFFFVLLIGQIDHLLAQESLGSWGFMLPYTPANTLVRAGDRFFVGVEKGAMFSYTPSDNSIDTYTPAEGLSTIDIMAMAYSPSYQSLLIAYSNSRIDLWKNNSVTPITDIERSSIAANKTIYNIAIKGDTAYFCCSFGLVVYDLVNLEVRDTYVLGNNGNPEAVYDIEWNSDYLAVATESGVKITTFNTPNLADANQWQRITTLPNLPAREIVTWNNMFYVSLQQESNNTDHLWRYDPQTQTQQLILSEAGWYIKDLSMGNNRLVVSRWQYQYTAQHVRIFDNETQYVDYSYWQLKFPLQSILDEQNVLWVADYAGLHRIAAPGDGQLFLPNSPTTPNLADLSVKNSELWVATGAVNASFNYTYSQEGVCRWKDNEWTTYKNNTTFNMFDFISVAQHPTKDIAYFGSFQSGLLEFDGTTFTQYRENNSNLGSAVGDPNSCRVGGMAFDQYNNLWIANWLSEEPIVVKQDNGEWRSFKPNISSNRNFFDMVIDDLGQIWTIEFREGILVMNHNNTLENDDDDQYTYLKNTAGKGNLPASTVMCIEKDKEGTIWAGTTNGIAVFYCPYSVFNGGCEAELPYVEVDGYGANLFQNQIVRSIAVDGANRKWVGTENGLFLVSADGTSTLKSFTTENSPLISNVIVSLAIDDATGRIYVGTDKGLMYYQGDALGGDDKHHDVLVYPNPVSPGYEGNVMVKGLAANALVKITDINGNLVHEGQALGSQLIWDAKDARGNKVSSGVYLVFSSNSSMDDHAVAKIVVVR